MGWGGMEGGTKKKGEGTLVLFGLLRSTNCLPSVRHSGVSYPPPPKLFLFRRQITLQYVGSVNYVQPGNKIVLEGDCFFVVRAMKLLSLTSASTL